MKDSSTLRERAFFHNSAISTERMSDMDFRENFITDVSVVPVKFWKHSGSGVNQMQTPDSDQILLGGSIRSLTARHIMITP